LTAEDGTVAPHLEFTNSDGLSNTKWTLGNNNAQQSIKASVKTNSTTVIKSVTFKATANYIRT